MADNSVKHTDGEDRGKIMLFALSTCMWCRKTKQLMQDLGVAYDWIDVDLLDKPEQQRVAEEVKRQNPDNTFPVIVINDDKCIVGYDPDRLQAELHKWK